MRVRKRLFICPKQCAWLLGLVALALVSGCAPRESAPSKSGEEPKSTTGASLDCPPGSVAMVDDRVITREDADKRARMNLKTSGVVETDPDFERKLIGARKGAVDFLIRAYVMQAAATETIEISTREAEAELMAWKMRVPSREKWEEFLKINNMTEEAYKEILVRDLRIRKQMEKAAMREVPTPSPEEAQQFYDINTLAFSWPNRVRYDEISWICRPELPAASREQARAGMDKIAFELSQQPARFDEYLAREATPNGWGPIGMPLPYQETKKTPEAIQAALQSLVQGEISKVIETPDGFSLIRIASLSQTYQNAYPEIVTSIYTERCRVNLEAWVKRQEQRHKIRICDVEYYRGEVASATK